MARGQTGIARKLCEIGRSFHARGWALGTSGNFSAVLSRRPLRLAITATGIAKDCLGPGDILQCDAAGSVVGRRHGRPSAETLLHLEIARLRHAAAVLHTHSVWGTLASEHCAERGGLNIEGYEMLKGLQGIRTHQHQEWLPILENSQDMKALAASIEDALAQHPDCHGFLLRRHGLYTWGQDLVQAKRHVEILEFLLELVGRKTGMNG